MKVIWTLEVWSVPGGWRLVDSFEKLKEARLTRDHLSAIATRIRRWEPSK